MWLRMKIFCLFVLIQVAICNGEDCKTKKAFKVLARTENDLKFLDEIQRRSNELSLTIEKPARNLNHSFVFTTPECLESRVLSLMRSFHVSNYEVFNPKFEYMEESTKYRRFNHFDPNIVTRMYLSHSEINNYIHEMAASIRKINPKISVDVINEGWSIEKRQIKSITIKYREKSNNPVIFIDAGIHAREWHSNSMGLFLINKLADEAAADTSGIIFHTTFVIVPNVNPDGYEFSRKGDKMWRKTRKRITSECIGVDGNRNYDIRWSEGTAELNPCSQVYKGDKPFSEPETKIIKNIMLRYKESCQMYISIHTYGNSILYPWGYTTQKHPSHQKLHKVAKAGVDAAFSETGVKFDASQSGASLYVAAGGSDDYAIDIGIPYAYTLELGAEELGFSVPPEYLNQTLQAGFIAIKGMVQQVIQM